MTQLETQISVVRPTTQKISHNHCPSIQISFDKLMLIYIKFLNGKI